MFRFFQIALRGGWENPLKWEVGIENYTGWAGIFLLGEGNLSRSDFDDSNVFQS